jgi:hypothetical protein
VGALSCTEPISAMPDVQYTDELIAVQALRTIFHMEGGRSVPYPWTQGSFYDWMKSKIGGVDIRANGSYCCENYNGKWFIVIRSLSTFERRQHKEWRGLSRIITLLGHETRHVEGFPHVGGCPLFPTATYGCDQAYDPSNPSPYGVEWWLHAKWLSGEVNVGFGCLESAMTIATGHLNAANNDYRQRFVTQPPPLLTMPQLPGGPCPAGSSPTATQTPSPMPTPTALPTPPPTTTPALTPTPMPPHVDSDGDGFIDHVEAGTPLCNGVNDDTFEDGVVDDGCPGGPMQSGAFSEAQFKTGTGPQDPCGSDGWPLDLVSSPSITANRFDVADLGSFVAPVRRFGKNPGETGFSSRWDLVPGNSGGSGWINVVDVAATITGTTGYPPMLGGLRAFSQSCPFPP